MHDSPFPLNLQTMGCFKMIALLNTATHPSEEAAEVVQCNEPVNWK